MLIDADIFDAIACSYTPHAADIAAAMLCR